ncbi:2-deoxy-D-gluconate 3-dehydrogenase [Kineobactrum sediminis]|uniref:2-deoxy-D-gluconate 3-dehydrogenase n=1 Tax=Kineobactrum sediminis TaxID=1905677 RepID=A0A2N5Y7J8_9GAMM|nr:SDR family oxidoreductase [Kineobactrum sediminis]PLW84347.1 2-deoxy-D-gluconate 3-dehydrogenase [Kineobactrum sediminis]
MVPNYFQLNKKIALVTGASSGLGVHFANVLANEGATVILAARRVEKLAQEVAAIKAAGGKADSVAMDVTSPDSVQQAFADIAARHGAIDILINNAGVASDPIKFLDTGEEDWNRIIETNLNGAWRVARAGARQMAEAGVTGSIVNIGSIYGLHTGALKAAYNVSKTGVVQLTKAMAIELCRNRIRVNALCPGWFLTDINSEYFHSESGERYIKTIPARRMGELEDLTVPLLMLASNTAGGYMTGTTVTVDGGMVESPI